jgi:hypothetical protein
MIRPFGTRGDVMRQRWIPMLAVTVAASFLAVAPASALPKDEFIVVADNICSQAFQLRAEVADEFFSDLPRGQDPAPEELALYVEQVAPITQQQIDSIRALDPPPGDKKKVKRILKLAQKALDKVVADPGVVLEGNPFAKADKASQKYGFQVCGSDLT